MRALRRGGGEPPRTVSTPPVPADLLEWLEAEYPPRCRQLSETELEHQEYAGAVKLVERLRALNEERTSAGTETIIKEF